jgi:hypothetical protein
MKSLKLLAAVSAFAFASLPAIAQEDTGETRGGSVTIENSDGRITTIDRSISRDGNTATGQSVVSVNDGSGAVRDSQRVYDPETNSYTSTSTTTTNSGATTSSARTTSCDPATGSCSRSTEFVNRNGEVRTSIGTATRAEDGSVVGQSTMTRANGDVISRDLASSGEAGNRSGTLTATGPNGTRTSDFERSASAEEGRSRSVQTMLPDGRTASVDSNAQCADGSCNRSVRRTGPNGNSETVESTKTRTAPGEFENTRSRTNEQTGKTREKKRWVRVDRRKGG